MSRDINGGFFAPTGSLFYRAVNANSDTTYDFPLINNEAFQMFARPNVALNQRDADGYRKPSAYWMAPYTLVGPAIAGATRTGRQVVSTASIVSTPTVIYDRFIRGDITYDAKGEALVQLPLPTALDAFAEHNLKQEVRTKVLTNVKDELLDVSMVLAEIRGTSQTVANSMLRVARSLDVVRRRKPESFAYLMHGRLGVDKRRITQRFLKETAGTFLEWKYGITPTLIDYTNACNALDITSDGKLFDNPPLCVARATVKRFFSNEVQPSWNVGSKLDKAVCKTEVTASARCDYRISGEGLRGLSQFGLGPGTMATVLWDKTPFSFVLDMMLPVADLIKAWTALSGVNPIGYSETIYQKHTFPSTLLSGNTGHYKLSARTSTITTNEFVRFASSEPPMPLPFIRNPVNIGNISTVLALFTQLRDKPKRAERLYGFDNKNL